MRDEEHDLDFSFWTDLDDDLSIARFPEDFADYLRELGREVEADTFLDEAKQYHELNPDWDQSLEDIVDLAEEYARVSISAQDLHKPRKLTYADIRRTYRDSEIANHGVSDTPLPFDQEAELVRRSLEDQTPPAAPIDMDEHQHPDCVVYVTDDDDILDIMFKTMVTLRHAGYIASAKSFQFELTLMVKRSEPTDWDMFELAWSYVELTGAPGSQIERRIQERERHHRRELISR
jgi:hypothetical protein